MPERDVACALGMWAGKWVVAVLKIGGRFVSLLEDGGSGGSGSRSEISKLRRWGRR